MARPIFAKNACGYSQLSPNYYCMDAENIQVLFFQHLKRELPVHLSLVDEISELLGISNDSAYRRLRGEKPISFEELKKLCAHFHLSLDQFLHIGNDSIVFHGKSADKENFDFETYLAGILKLLQYMNSFKNRELLYLNKDVPIFHHFYYPELASFKYFFWMKTILHYPEYARMPFSFDTLIEPLINVGNKIARAYTDLPSMEIWNIESINSTIRQIEYYRNTGNFSSQKDIRTVYEALGKCIDHIEAQAEAGYKFFPEDVSHTERGAYKMYFNEFILGDNTIMAVLDGNMITFINHSVINILQTRDPDFCRYTYEHFHNIIKRSTLISEVGEKERSRFFKTIREKINSRKNALL